MEVGVDGIGEIVSALRVVGYESGCMSVMFRVEYTDDESLSAPHTFSD